MNNNLAYIVDCGTNEILMQGLEFLFSRRMVFTYLRINSIEKLKDANFGCWKIWRYIYAGHNDECKKVFNTAEYDTVRGFVGYNPKAKLVKISWDNFVRDILPTL